ncbi:MAG: helix-turn-helix domain-containing protein [bacterium]
MITSLLQLGLSEKEAQVYEQLTLSEALTAATLARRTNIKRASIYEVIYGLEKKNLLGSYRKYKTQYFYIDTPEKLILQHQTKLKIAEDIVRSIRSRKHHQTIAIEVHRDAEGFQKLYHEILTKSGREFCAWSNFESFDRIIPKKEDMIWTKERVKLGTRPRLIMVDNPTSQEFQKHDKDFPRQTRLIQSAKNFTSTLVISQ